MSNAAGTPSKDKNSGMKSAPPSEAKGKGKEKVKADVSMEEEDEEDEEEDDDDGDDDEEMDEDDDDEDEEEDMDEIDTTQIRSRRTRGVKVDYTSAEALKRAGLKPEDMEDDDDAEMK